MSVKKSMYRRLAPGVVAVASVIVVGLSQPVLVSRADSATARAVIRNANHEKVGVVVFTQNDAKVNVRVVAHGLPEEFHGFHIHSVGTCDAPDFVSAGAHFNPANEQHSLHAGDLPALLVNHDGTAQASVATDRFQVADLLAGNGTAVIVHANRDNYANIPARYAPAADATTLATGDAGARIACGVIEPVSEPAEDDGAD